MNESHAGKLITANIRRVGILLALCFSAHSATAQRTPSPRTKVGPRGWINPTNQGKGHPIRYSLPVRPLNYRINPDPNDPSQRAFSATTPSAATWVRAGTDVNRTFGDYYVDPFVWFNNNQRPANAVWDPALGRWVDPTGQWVWRDPADLANWISTRTIRVIIRQPFTPPR
jgi:hypothetical protein